MKPDVADVGHCQSAAVARAFTSQQVQQCPPDGLVLARARRCRAPPAVRRAAKSGWTRRWWGMLSIAVQQALAGTALGCAWPTVSPTSTANARRLRVRPTRDHNGHAGIKIHGGKIISSRVVWRNFVANTGGCFSYFASGLPGREGIQYGGSPLPSPTSGVDGLRKKLWEPAGFFCGPFCQLASRSQYRRLAEGVSNGCG